MWTEVSWSDKTAKKWNSSFSSSPSTVFGFAACPDSMLGWWCPIATSLPFAITRVSTLPVASVCPPCDQSMMCLEWADRLRTTQKHINGEILDGFKPGTYKNVTNACKNLYHTINVSSFFGSCSKIAKVGRLCMIGLLSKPRRSISNVWGCIRAECTYHCPRGICQRVQMRVQAL